MLVMKGQRVPSSKVHREIIVPRFVVEEVFLDHLALVTSGNDEVGDPEVRQILHDVPKNGPTSHLHHGLGSKLSLFPQARPKAACKEDCLHF